MYENEIYSDSNAGSQTSGVYSGTDDNRQQTNNVGNGYFDSLSGANSAGNANNASGANAQYHTYQTGSADAFAHENRAAQSSQPEGKEKKHIGGGYFRKAMLSVSLGLFFGLFAGVGFYAVQQGSGQLSANSGTAVTTPTEQTGSGINYAGAALTNTSNVTLVDTDVTQVVEDVMPAMVSIVNNYTQTGTIFGQTYSQPGAASGSGIIVAETDTELLIVSNYHVVEDATTLDVTFIDGSQAQASIKGTDSAMDLAVVAIPLDSLTQETKNAIAVATLGNSDDLKMGEPVIAIGNALGYGQSVTNGIVSALDREITKEDGTTGTFIQTNAAINPGNSGGALLNINGEVIGINSNKIGGTAVEGMGYAIPISSASPIIADLMERQTRTKVAEGDTGYLGITLQEVTSQIAQAYSMPQGVYVVKTEEGGAAQKAGIVSGDIITEFEGERLTSYADLQDILQYFAAGDTATVTVMRPENGEYVSHEYKLVLGSRPSQTN